MTPNQIKLREYMAHHELTRQETAEALGASVSCINGWLNPVTSKSHRPISAKMMKYIDLYFKDRKL